MAEMTPLLIRSCLYFYYTGDSVMDNEQAHTSAIKPLMDLGLIRPNGSNYHTTPKGDAWVKALMRTPMPRLVWVDEAGRALSEPTDTHVSNAEEAARD